MMHPPFKLALLVLILILFTASDLFAVNQDQAQKIVNEYLVAIKLRDDQSMWAVWEKLNSDQDLLAYVQKYWPHLYDSYRMLLFAKQLREDIKRRDEVYAKREERIKLQNWFNLNSRIPKPVKPLTNGDVVQRFPNVVNLTNHDSVINSPNFVVSDNREEVLKYPNQLVPSNQEIMESRILSSFGPRERRYGVNPE